MKCVAAIGDTLPEVVGAEAESAKSTAKLKICVAGTLNSLPNWMDVNDMVGVESSAKKSDSKIST
eukprot:scaffold3611_cov364-Prasinococcus_capsulatus_cf.AAC.5